MTGFDDDEERPNIAVAHFSTDLIAPAYRHAIWSTTGWPSIASLFHSQPLDDFSTEADLVHLDQLFLQYAYSTARKFERGGDRAQSDGIDVLGVGIQLDGGPMSGEAGGRAFEVPQGAMLLLDMTRPCRITHPSGPSIQVAVPRALATRFLGSVPALHGTVVAPEAAAMLVSHLLQLRRALPDMPVGQQTLLMRTILDLLAVALGRQAVIDLPPHSTDHLPAVAAKEIAIREIDQRLGLPSLTVSSLCERLRVSRSTLFRLFEPDGGVQSFIRRRRLEAAREALLDETNPDAVGTLAHRLGFSDASHMTRQFRAAYGLTPSAFRRAHRGG